jgi:microcin C transport system permease protein
VRSYFLKRLAFIPLTLLGVTLIVFALTRLVPGGPLERVMMEARMGHGDEHGASRSTHSEAALSDEQIAQLKTYYGLDKPWYLAYAAWLGKIVQGDLGESYRYNEPVWGLIAARLPISAYYGIITLILTYGICVPLGVLKAIRQGSALDKSSSAVLLLGYSIPSYVLGSLLVVLLAARTGWFPTGGFVSNNFDELTAWGKTIDLLRHSILPLFCYLIGSLAFLTAIVKNSTIDVLAADYMRTAAAKGLPTKSALFKHALRNALIPLATNFGQNLTLLISGSFFIETLFDIDGFGLLGYSATVDRDYPVVMGILLIGALLLLVGNLISDLMVMMVDPRVRFEKGGKNG